MSISRVQRATILPYFTEDDLLPVGDYPLTIDQLRQSHLVTGEGNPSANWDKDWRLHIVDNLEILTLQLQQVGISNIYVDGSFVENKDHPNDIDGYFECDLLYYATGQLERDLNALDPLKVWTWNHNSRTMDPNSAKMQLPMWHKYRVELYVDTGQPACGIKDEFGNEQPFAAAFRKSRAAHRPKGIIKIIG